MLISFNYAEDIIEYTSLLRKRHVVDMIGKACSLCIAAIHSLQFQEKCCGALNQWEMKLTAMVCFWGCVIECVHSVLFSEKRLGM